MKTMLILISLIVLLTSCSGDSLSNSVKEQDNSLYGNWQYIKLDTSAKEIYIEENTSFSFNKDNTGKRTSNYIVKSAGNDTIISFFEVPFTYNWGNNKADTIITKIKYGEVKILKQTNGGNMGSSMRSIINNVEESDTIFNLSPDTILLHGSFYRYKLTKAK